VRKGVAAGILLAGLAGLIFPGQEARGAEVELGQVVVTATKTEIEIAESPQSISVITSKEIAESPHRSIAEIIQQAPAVDVSSYGPAGSLATAQIRGSSASQVLILVNGRRINDPQNGQFDLNNLPIAKDEIERIEILRGSASALYGADAMGGVINILTKTPSREPQTSASVSYGRFDTGQVSLSHRWKPGAFSYDLSVAREKSDGYRPNSDSKAWIAGGELGYEIGQNSEITLGARYIDKEVGLPGTVTFPDPDDRQKDKIWLLNVGYQGQITQRFKLNFKGFHNNYRNTFNSGSQGALSSGESALHKSFATGGDLQGIWALGETHLLTAGGETIEDRLDSSLIGTEKATRGALYMQDEWAIVSSLTATYGLRWDYHSIYGDQLDPRVGILWRLPAAFRLRASVGRSYRAPTFNDLYWPASGYTEGNPDLQPEKAWTYELGLERNFGKYAIVKAAGFYRDVQDLINWAPGPDFVWRPSNISAAKIWGGELEMTFYPFKGLAIPLNYSYLYPQDESTGEPIPNKPKHMVNVGIEYLTSFGLKTNVRGRYVQYYVNQTSTLNKDYFVLDARVAYGFKIYQQLSGEAFLSLTNALDRDYETVEGYPMPPQSLTGGLSLAF
jgi:vitamin B12 transporter